MKALSPAKAAQIIIGGIEDDRYRVLIGKDAKFMDTIYRFNPQQAAKFISKKMQALLSG